MSKWVVESWEWRTLMTEPEQEALSEIPNEGMRADLLARQS
ncbi:hypothetical protein [Sphingomonas daechungensis]|nr:hypothetical protein [Sphingomonas daechungensis]